jgi:hypothetical protein
MTRPSQAQVPILKKMSLLRRSLHLRQKNYLKMQKNDSDTTFKSKHKYSSISTREFVQKTIFSVKFCCLKHFFQERIILYLSGIKILFSLSHKIRKNSIMTQRYIDSTQHYTSVKKQTQQ